MRIKEQRHVGQKRGCIGDIRIETNGTEKGAQGEKGQASRTKGGGIEG